jgi:defect-in-organelle-trafficking protein DotD
MLRIGQANVNRFAVQGTQNVKHTNAFLVFVIALCLGACEPMPKRDPQVVTSPDKVSLMMAEAADKASNALETLAAVEQAKSPGVAVEPIHNAPEELERAITVNWVGPPDQITKMLADRAGYDFLAVGNRPPVPIVVNIDVENEPVIDVLRDIGLQLGARGDIKVDSVRKIVEIHYSPVTGLGG